MAEEEGRRREEGDIELRVEQRKDRRHQVNIQGVFSSGFVQAKEAVVLDLSMGGCRVACTISMPPDSAIQLQIRPHLAAAISVPCAIVRWTSGYAFGVQFRELPEFESNALTCLPQSLPPSSQDAFSSPSRGV